LISKVIVENVVLALLSLGREIEGERRGNESNVAALKVPRQFFSCRAGRGRLDVGSEESAEWMLDAGFVLSEEKKKYNETRLTKTTNSF
jgi:hypothetical protein